MHVYDISFILPPSPTFLRDRNTTNLFTVFQGGKFFLKYLIFWYKFRSSIVQTKNRNFETEVLAREFRGNTNLQRYSEHLDGELRVLALNRFFKQFMAFFVIV